MFNLNNFSEMEIVVSLAVIITSVICLLIYVLRDLNVITDGVGTMLAPVLFVIAVLVGYGFVFFGGEARYIAIMVTFIIEGICFYINAVKLDEYYNANREAVILISIVGMVLFVPSVIRLVVIFIG